MQKFVHRLKIARCGPWSALGGLEYLTPLKDPTGAFMDFLGNPRAPVLMICTAWNRALVFFFFFKKWLCYGNG